MRVLAALLVSSSLWAQAVSVGLRAGIPVTPMLAADEPRQVSGPRGTIGPLIEVRLWRGVAFGADFLLNRASLASGSAGLWRWEAPVTLVYRFSAPARPFVRTGVSFNRVFDIDGATECARGPFGEQFYCLDGASLAELRHRGTSGFVAGGGFRFQFMRLWIDPEVRFTHWTDRNFGVRDSAVRSNLNEAAILVGVVF